MLCKPWLTHGPCPVVSPTIPPPPDKQIVDTVDLFHAKRSRKLSLRFLASYLLQASIQEHTHDSIEDAATALRCVSVCGWGGPTSGSLVAAAAGMGLKEWGWLC